MADPFLLKGPAVISFSFGRTSAYLLWRILQAYGGRLPDDVIPVFCNTGKERLESLDFGERCSQRWGVPVRWLEYRATPSGKLRKKDQKPLWTHTYVEVDYATASRHGEPYEMAIAMRNMLPNIVTRFCTGELKIKTKSRFVRSRLGWEYYQNAIGLRYDEPGRVSNLMAIPQAATTFANLWGEEQENDDEVVRTNPPGEEQCVPLYDGKVTLEEVMAFWQKQREGVPLNEWLALPKDKRPGWDLELRPDEGNCDLCFLKGADKIYRLIAERPESAEWWIRQEALALGKDKTWKSSAARFRKDRASYARMLEMAKGGAEPLWSDEDVRPCHCTD